MNNDTAPQPYQAPLVTESPVVEYVQPSAYPWVYVVIWGAVLGLATLGLSALSYVVGVFVWGAIGPRDFGSVLLGLALVSTVGPAVVYILLLAAGFYIFRRKGLKHPFWLTFGTLSMIGGVAALLSYWAPVPTSAYGILEAFGRGEFVWVSVALGVGLLIGAAAAALFSLPTHVLSNRLNKNSRISLYIMLLLAPTVVTFFLTAFLGVPQ